jgi:hypothetical protein
MDHLFDEFSKSLSESLPRRESLRRLGAVFAGAILAPLGMETAWAKASKPVDPCKAFCNCRNAKQQSECLAACQACGGNTSRLAGSCGSYTCCSIAACKGVCSNLKSDPNCGACGNNCGAFGETCCGSYCADLKTDVFNCGRCGTVCAPPGENEYVSCVSGACVYDCVAGSIDCNGTCTFLDSDPDNCGACGHVCPGSAPYCYQGACNACGGGEVLCGNSCVELDFDPDNCGACGNFCGGSTPYCYYGSCTDCVSSGGAICNGECIDVSSDGFNCGGCGITCSPLEFCSWGSCYGTGDLYGGFGY